MADETTLFSRYEKTPAARLSFGLSGPAVPGFVEQVSDRGAGGFDPYAAQFEHQRRFEELHRQRSPAEAEGYPESEIIDCGRPGSRGRPDASSGDGFIASAGARGILGTGQGQLFLVDGQPLASVAPPQLSDTLAMLRAENVELHARITRLEAAVEVLKVVG